MKQTLLHWKRGRREEGSIRTMEWIGYNNAGEPIARIVRVQGPISAGWRSFRAVARDEAARVVDLRPGAPDGEPRWLACVGSRVVGRADQPLQAVRAVEAAIGDDQEGLAPTRG